MNETNFIDRDLAAVPCVSSRWQHLLVVGRDEPQLHVHVASPFLSSNEVQHVLVSHPVQVENLILVLPRLFVLTTQQQTGQRSGPGDPTENQSAGVTRLSGDKCSNPQELKDSEKSLKPGHSLGPQGFSRAQVQTCGPMTTRDA